MTNEEKIEKVKNMIRETYDPRNCSKTSEWSCGNSDDVFNDGIDCGSSWLAYEIGCILEMELETPIEPEYSWM